MESEYKNEATEDRPKLLMMNGARTKRFKHLLRQRLSREEAIELSQYPINHRANDTTNPTNNEQSRRPQEEHSSQIPSHPVCKVSYRELKNMSKVLPNAKLRSRFYYQTRVLGIDPDESLKTLLGDSSAQELPGDELGGHESGKSLSDKVKRQSTSRLNNTPSSHLTPSKGSSRSIYESESFTQQRELIPNSICSLGMASSSRITRDSDRLPPNIEDPYYDGNQPPRHDRPYSGSERNQLDFRNSHTGYPSKYGFASASQTAWNEINFPPAPSRTERMDMAESYDDEYESGRRDRSHLDSEFVIENFHINYEPPRYDKSDLDTELGWKDVSDRDPPRWMSPHPDSELSQSHFSGSYDPPRYDSFHGSEHDQNDVLVDHYGPPRWDRSRPGSELGQEDLRERLRYRRSHAGREQDQREDFSDRYDPPTRDSPRRSSDLDYKIKYDIPRRRPQRSRRESESDRKGSSERYDPPRRERSRLGSEAVRKDSLDRRYDRPRRDRSHRRSEPDRKNSRASPKGPRPPEDPQSSNSLKSEYESFIRNLNWSPPQITTATETTKDQSDPVSRKRKLSTQVAHPSVVVLGDIVPLVTPPILPGLPIKRPRLDQDAINRGISSLMDPSRWATPEEGTPEEVLAWKQDYQRFLENESWKQDYRRVLENISKTGNVSKVNRGQNSANSPDQSKEIHQAGLGPTGTRERKEYNQSTQPKTESIQEPRGNNPQDKRTSPKSTQDQVKKTPSSLLNHRRQAEIVLRNTRQDQIRQARVKSPITAGTQSNKEQANLPHKISKGSNRQLPSSSSTSRMPLPKISTAEETKDPTAPVFIVPTNFPKERLSAQQMDAIESNILEAILEINDESMKPSFQESFRRNGKYGVVCNDRFSNDWLQKHIQMNEPWPNASLQIVTDDSTKVRVSVKLPLCQNDDNDRILKFITKQNTNLDAKDWTVFHRLDSDTSTSVMFLVDEDSVGGIRDCGKINFKMGRVDVVIEGDSEVELGLSGVDCESARLSSGYSHGRSAPSNSAEKNTVNAGWERSRPQGMPQPLDLPDTRLGFAENSTEFISPRGLLNPCRDQSVSGGPNQPHFREQRYFESSLETKFPSLLESSQMLEPPPAPFLGDALVTRGNAHSSSSRSGHRHVEQGLSRRNIRSRSPLSRDSGHPNFTSRPDRIPTSGGIIRRDRALSNHQQRSSWSPPRSRNQDHPMSRH